MAGFAELAALTRVLLEFCLGCGGVGFVVSHPFAVKLRMDGARSFCRLRLHDRRR